MIIKKIALNRFKKFESLELLLLPGLNVVKGPNEAGKSTLHSAVIAGLFFNPSHRRAEIRNNVSWNSEKMYEIDLLITDDQNEYFISKDFENRRIHVVEANSEKEILDSSELDQELYQWLGFNSADLFRSTVCIEQDKISQVTKGDKEIGDILQSTITGEDDAAAHAAIASLETLLGQSPKEKSDGASSYTVTINKLSKQIKDLEEEKVSVQGDIKRTSRANARLLEIEKTLSDIHATLETKGNLKTKNDHRQGLKSELEILEEKLEHAINSLKLDEEITNLGERLNVYQPFFNLSDEDIEQFHSLLGRKQSLEELQNSLEDQLKYPKQKVVQKRPKLNHLFIVGLILLWVGLIATIISRYMLILAFLGLTALCAGIALMISQSDVSIELSPDQIRNQINRANEQLELVNESIKYFLSRTKCSSAQEFISKLEGYKPLRKRKSEKEAELSGMIGGQTIKKIKDASNELASKIKTLKEELKGLDSFALDPEAYQRLLDELERAGQEESELEKEAKSLEIITTSSHTTGEDLARIDEEVASLEQKLRSQEQHVAITKKCLKYLKAAREKTLRSATDVLKQEIERYISTITDNRYEKVKVDANTLNISIYAPEKHGFVDIQRLSRATIDQIYLAARLGLVKLVSGNKKPPLLLDDPFIAFDDNRLETTMELLIKVAKDYQILLFTCSSRYDQYADKVIDLRTYSVTADIAMSKQDGEIDPAVVSDQSVPVEPPQDRQQ